MRSTSGLPANTLTVPLIALSHFGPHWKTGRKANRRDEKQDDEKQDKQDKVPLIPLSAGLPTHPEQTRPEQELARPRFPKSRAYCDGFKSHVYR